MAPATPSGATRSQRVGSWITGDLSRLLMVLVLVVSGCWLSSAHGSPLSERGKALAKLHCVRCHVVSEDTRGMGISSTPSFMILISALEDWYDRFATFHERKPHPSLMRLEGADKRPDHLPASIHEVILSLDDLEALMAYVEALAQTVQTKAN